MHSAEDYNFASFIITYNRPAILKNTVSSLLKQTVLPQKILIVDNSDNTDTRLLIDSLALDVIEYIATGQNLGPAGAAAIAIRHLSKQGFDAIHWQDDDDPPRGTDYNDKLLKLLFSDPGIGMVGVSGTRLSKLTGQMKRVGDDELRDNSVVSVDAIGGNQHIIINSKVYTESGCIPTAELFFGFEELDFCLQIKASGYQIVVPCEAMLKNRIASGRINLKKPKPLESLVSKQDVVWRQYYSYRNLCYILLHERKLYIAFAVTVIRGISKGVYSFKLGRSVGSAYIRYIYKGIRDGVGRKLGFTVKPALKY